MKRFLGTLSFFAVCAAGFAVFFLPLYLLRPFAPQTPNMVATAHTLRTYGPWIGGLLGIVGLLLTVALWRAAERRWTRVLSRVGLVAGLTVLGGSFWMTLGNTFEKLFAPLPEARFVAAADTDYPRDEDMVLAVEVDGRSRAYPVPIVGYHHVVNDRLADEPFVVTY